VTHLDPRAVDGALYVAELCALCVQSEPRADRAALARRALAVVDDVRLRAALTLASSGRSTPTSPWSGPRARSGRRDS